MFRWPAAQRNFSVIPPKGAPLGITIFFPPLLGTSFFSYTFPHLTLLYVNFSTIAFPHRLDHALIRSGECPIVSLCLLLLAPPSITTSPVPHHLSRNHGVVISELDMSPSFLTLTPGVQKTQRGISNF